MRLRGYLFVVGLVLVDQVVKWWARNALENSIIDVWDGVFWLRHTQNEGIAFSLPFPRLILILFSLVVVAILFYFLNKNNLKKIDKIAFSLVLGGAIGNLLDRIFIGTVTDFLSFWSFPIFNLADTWITCGVAIFMVAEFFAKKKEC